MVICRLNYIFTKIININININILTIMNAQLDCISKQLKLTFEGKIFDINTNDGDLGDSWNAIKSKSGIYDCNLSWDEDADQPSFTLYPVTEQQDHYGVNKMVVDWSKGIPIPIEISRGTKEDYFGVVYPNGFVSWFETFAYVCREITTHKKYDNFRSQHGVTALDHLCRKITDDFEVEYTQKQFFEIDFVTTIEEYVKNYKI